MKYKFTFVMNVLLAACAWAQTGSTALAPIRAADEAAVRKAALNYVEGWYEANGDRMQAALHPELAKRIAKTDPATGKTVLQQLSAEQLVDYTRKGGGKNTPPEKQIKDVRVLDIFENAATVRAEMAGWVDYMHLAKIDGEWKIVNVLWATKPKK